MSARLWSGVLPNPNPGSTISPSHGTPASRARPIADCRSATTSATTFA